MKNRPEAYPKAFSIILIKQGRENTHVQHPHINISIKTLGINIAIKKFLNLSIHRNNKKQGKLKKEVHCIIHILSEN